MQTADLEGGGCRVDSSQPAWRHYLCAGVVLSVAVTPVLLQVRCLRVVLRQC